MAVISAKQVNLSEDYLECVAKQQETLRPFGDIPRDMKAKVIRSFVTARSFVQGLSVSADVVKKVSQVSLVYLCFHRHTRFTVKTLLSLQTNMKSLSHKVFIPRLEQVLVCILLNVPEQNVIWTIDNMVVCVRVCLIYAGLIPRKSRCGGCMMFTP